MRGVEGAVVVGIGYDAPDTDDLVQFEQHCGRLSRGPLGVEFSLGDPNGALNGWNSPFSLPLMVGIWCPLISGLDRSAYGDEDVVRFRPFAQHTAANPPYALTAEAGAESPACSPAPGMRPLVNR